MGMRCGGTGCQGLVEGIRCNASTALLHPALIGWAVSRFRALHERLVQQEGVLWVCEGQVSLDGQALALL